MNEYILMECNRCKLTFIIPEDGIRKAEVMGNYFACPLCHGGVSQVGAYGDLKQCMEEARVYKRVNGRVKQVK